MESYRHSLLVDLSSFLISSTLFLMNPSDQREACGLEPSDWRDSINEKIGASSCSEWISRFTFSMQFLVSIDVISELQIQMRVN